MLCWIRFKKGQIELVCEIKFELYKTVTVIRAAFSDDP